VKHVELL